MSPDIWTRCAHGFEFSAYDGLPWRVVEAQHVVATRKLVDSDEEQQILEDVIDGAKPPKPYDEECAKYHYLLWTPFRYPPLEHGSRLGLPDQRGVWYGSEELETAFAEKAYYTFLLRDGSAADFGVFDADVTAFRAHAITQKCADLTQPPFKSFEEQLSSPLSYSASQIIALELRGRGAEIILFRSARCPNRGTNVGINTVSVFTEARPSTSTTWFCVSSHETVEFKPAGFQGITPKRSVFRKSDFIIDGRFPEPQFSD